MSSYTLVDHVKIDSKVTFLRINPNDVKLTLKEIYLSLSDLSWISTFDKVYQTAFTVRAEETVNYIHKNIVSGASKSVTKDSGEIIVSELSRLAVVNELGYLDIPLAELIKSQAYGNDGFDFYSVNLSDILLFGEAKYIARDNAYGKSFKQIEEMEGNQQDVSDLLAVSNFCSDNVKTNLDSGLKGFMAAFSSKGTPTDKLIKNIKKNSDYLSLVKFDELICIAVNL